MVALVSGMSCDSVVSPRADSQPIRLPSRSICQLCIPAVTPHADTPPVPRQTTQSRHQCDQPITPQADTRQRRTGDGPVRDAPADVAAIPHLPSAAAPKSCAPMSPAFPPLGCLPDIPYSSPPVGIRVSCPLTSRESRHIECCAHRNTGESTTTRPVPLRDFARRGIYRVACPSTIATIREPVI